MTERPGLACTVVIPTVGRPSLGVVLRGIAAQAAPAEAPDATAEAPDAQAAGPVAVVVVDDRPLGTPDLDLADPALVGTLVGTDVGMGVGMGVGAGVGTGAGTGTGTGTGTDDPHPGRWPWPVRVVRTGGRGPAAARNAGWRLSRTPWVAFLDDDVAPPDGWWRGLLADLASAADDVGGVQGRIQVPLPTTRPPTDWERSTAGLERAQWATADMAFRREALAAVGGFDERFPRAYREDADLALRLRRAGWRLESGRRTIVHPVRPADDRVSVRVQAGAADDALMRALHGPDWRELAGTGRGRFPWHVGTVAAAGVALLGVATRRGLVAAAGASAWAALTADFAVRRIAPGPRPGDPQWRAEWRRMALTSVVIPFAAVRHRVRGTWRWRGGAAAWPLPVRAVLFDRDGTLVHDVPYNGDPAAVRTVTGAREVLGDLRARGVRVGVITNQSGIGRGLITAEQADAVRARVEAELGPFDTWQQCPHSPADGCACRKPAPGMVLAAAAELGVLPAECAVVGDIGADVEAALAAGARAVLVPTPVTRPEEVAAAPVVAVDLAEAVALLRTPAADTGDRAAPAASAVLGPSAGTAASAASGESAAPSEDVATPAVLTAGRGVTA